jgi:succinate dehydrogenase / fumarate reductase cytochrome b subunit
MRLFSDSIGRKVVMAVTGMLMVLFIVGHLLGNLSVFIGPNALNAYADKLHSLGALLWVVRVVMIAAVVLHIVIAIQITLENSAAKPERYAVQRSLKATFASKNMIWTGLVLLAFVLYHLAHFTLHWTPGLVLGTDGLNRFDVYTMVTSAFASASVAAIYVVAMVALFLHLTHGIQSTFQSIGWSNGSLLPAYGRWGKAASTLFLIGYGAIPVLILVGLVAR